MATASACERGQAFAQGSVFIDKRKFRGLWGELGCGVVVTREHEFDTPSLGLLEKAPGEAFASVRPFEPTGNQRVRVPTGYERVLENMHKCMSFKK